jgi:hypothetical protein
VSEASKQLLASTSSPVRAGWGSPTSLMAGPGTLLRASSQAMGPFGAVRTRRR